MFIPIPGLFFCIVLFIFAWYIDKDTELDDDYY